MFPFSISVIIPSRKKNRMVQHDKRLNELLTKYPISGIIKEIRMDLFMKALLDYVSTVTDIRQKKGSAHLPGTSKRDTFP